MKKAEQVQWHDVQGLVLSSYPNAAIRCLCSMVLQLQ